ncbi:MAG TPA: ABC transporter permease [Blastocatellia bacterium]|nr:ABC transporter permease [Blastocatellia bacterium]
MQTLLQDLRYGARMLTKKPGFTAVAIITLALGVGANTAMFSVVNSLLLRPLPFKHAEQLVRVSSDFTKRNAKDVGVTVPELFDYRDRADVFEEVSGLYPINVNLTEVDEPERIEALLVSPNYFSILGADAAIGRTFQPDDYQPGITEIVVISDGLWKRRFGSDPGILGKKLRLDNDLFTIVGVMPQGFHHPGRGIQGEAEIWAPTGYAATPFQKPARGFYILSGVLGRLKPGVSVEAAQARLDVVAEDLRREFPNDFPESRGWVPRIIPLQDDLVGNVRPALLILLAAVAFVLLIACANVANLLLARASVRQREFAIRAALGASRMRLIRQLLTESAVLSLSGGLLGLLLTLWSVDALVLLLPSNLPPTSHVGIDARVLGFTLLVSLLTGFLFGVAPAFQATATKTAMLKDVTRGSTASQRANRLRGLLVVSEFALALVLLIGAGLLLRSFWRLQAINPGFNPNHVLTARFWMPQPNDPPTGPYFKHQQRLPFYRQVMQRITALPGVEEAGWVNRLPLGGQNANLPFLIEGRPLETADVAASDPFTVSPGYFRAMQIGLVRGRYFDDHDDENAPGVLLVSEGFADRFFPGEDPVGRRIRPGNRNSTAPWLTIVGVVRDVKTTALDSDNAPQMYRCIWQVSGLQFALVVRSAMEPAAMGRAISQEVRAVDPNMPIYSVRPMTEVMAVTFAQRRFAMLLLGMFAVVALLLSAVGIYAVMAYVVEQRTSEVGIRMALGARPGDVLRLIVGQGMRLVLLGVGVGLAAAFALTRLTASLLFNTSASDPLTFTAISLLLTLIALLAIYIPARRATRVDPMIALRYE